MNLNDLISSHGILAIVAILLLVVFIIEMIVIFKAISDDLKNMAGKGTLLIEGTIHKLTGKSSVALLEHKKSKQSQTTQPVSPHFKFKDIHTLEMIFDVPESQIKDIEFTEDDDFENSESGAKVKFADFLTEAQRERIYYFAFEYQGYADFLDQVEKKLKWKSGIKKKVLVLTDIHREKKITFSHYLAFEKSVLFDVIDPEIFWGVDVCVAVTHNEPLPTIKINKVQALFEKYDEIWVFEPKHNNGLMLKRLGLQDDDNEVKAFNEAYDH